MRLVYRKEPWFSRLEQAHETRRREPFSEVAGPLASGAKSDWKPLRQPQLAQPDTGSPVTTSRGTARHVRLIVARTELPFSRGRVSSQAGGLENGMPISGTRATDRFR